MLTCPSRAATAKATCSILGGGGWSPLLLCVSQVCITSHRPLTKAASTLSRGMHCLDVLLAVPFSLSALLSKCSSNRGSM